MAHICRTTSELAHALQGHPGLRRVYHPSLPDHASHKIAQRLYPSGTGGILTLELAGTGRDAVNTFMRAAESIPFSPTLADARSTLSHPATTSHSFMSSQARAAVGICDELVRISVGLEPAEMLIREITAALDQVANYAGATE